jgi:hypothetical protein
MAGDGSSEKPAGESRAGVKNGREGERPYPRFQGPLDDETVSLDDLVMANAMRSPFVEGDAERRAIGARYYPLLRAAFIAKYKGAQVVTQQGAGIGACLHAGDEGELEIFGLRNTIRYDWSSARRMQAELNELDDNAARWLPPKERRSIRLGIFSLISQLQTSIGRENKRHALEKQDDDPTEHLAVDLDFLRPFVGAAKSRLAEEAERAAQVVYTTGMAEGTGVLGLLCAALGGIFLWQDIPAVNGVGALAGGIGACLSVLQRLTSGRLKLDYRSDRKMLRLFGGVRPFVGAAFGMITFCVIKAGLLPDTIRVPESRGPLIAFVSFFAFFAAFNERFFQDMLRTASSGIGGGSDVDADGESAPRAEG